ncbi:hypothetical protein K443DRAFT_681521 [Laccaria amethystina LaAM-08-1]|uniref:Cytochrome c domain-containing protein n=1 Tax=Laccaria amethystina LaAM-08-1 TaxID=1095629 RepID=A0A0C9WLP1_9AGAR|nr:hypothetical protein K443DRAFT_681521 [Laccaria amethystina LaAM-08-1]
MSDQHRAPSCQCKCAHQTQTDAEKQFNTSSLYHVPDGYTPWSIRNDYPSTTPAHDPTPLFGPDPITQSEKYLEAVKTYCLEGMVENDFVPQKNKKRQWYHAPWMHYSTDGREPLHGLTSERYLPPREFSATQERYTQAWAVGFFNATGASVLGEMWKDPNDPQWTKNIDFPWNTVIYKLLFSNATNNEIPFLAGAPHWQAMIAVQPEDPTKEPDPAVRITNAPNDVRLLQMDIAVKDKRSTATGWVWGTFIYDGNCGKTGYDGLAPVGLSWGNDPKLDQKAYESGERAKDVWIDGPVNDLRASLNGVRPFWGWNGRLAGPVDNFISACQSCHSTAQWNPYTQSQGTSIVPPAPDVTADVKFIPVNDNITMTWFTNVPGGTAIAPRAFSADNSLQLMIGYENYVAWREKNNWEQGGKKGPPPVDRRPTHRRQGPKLEF